MRALLIAFLISVPLAARAQLGCIPASAGDRCIWTGSAWTSAASSASNTLTLSGGAFGITGGASQAFPSMKLTLGSGQTGTFLSLYDSSNAQIAYFDTDASLHYVSVGNIWSGSSLVLRANGGLANADLTQTDFYFTLSGGSQAQWDASGSAFGPFTTAYASVDFASTLAPTRNAYSQRYVVKGTPLVASNFSLSAGWGSTATVTVNRGGDAAFNITITSSGTGQAANPTITLLYQDGVWPAAPIAVAKIEAATSSADLSAPVTETTTTSQLVITFHGTPVAASTYTFSAQLLGYDSTQPSGATNPEPVALTTLPLASQRVMPLGDSIADGTAYPFFAGWRYDLWQRYVAAGVAFTFVGSMNDGPADLVAAGQAHNEGHPGDRIDQLDASIGTWMAAATPDVVLLMAGTNDALQGASAATMESRITTLINDILAASGTVKVVVSTVIPNTGTAETTIQAFNAALPGIVSAAGARVSLVDNHAALNYGTDIAGGTHPNAYGYYKMSIVWWNGLPR